MSGFQLAQLPEMPPGPATAPGAHSNLPHPDSRITLKSITNRGVCVHQDPHTVDLPARSVRRQTGNGLTQDPLHRLTPSDFIHEFPLEAAHIHI